MERPYSIGSSFGDYCFEDNDIIVEYIHDDLPEVREDLVERAGGDGSFLRSLHLGPRTIELECRAFRDRWESFDQLKDELAAVLLCGRERELSLRNHFGEYYMAHFTSFSEGDREGGRGIGAFTLTFVASDPVRYGRVREAEIPSGGSVGIDVTGTYPTNVSIRCESATGDDGSGVWGVRFDEGDFCHVEMPTSSGSVRIDCADRSVRVNGSVSMVTLDSNWPTLAPGSHAVRMDLGTGQGAVVRWQERVL